MKTPLNWISLYSDISDIIAKKGIKELAHEYSTHTAEIDGIEERFLSGVVIGKVLTCEKHPDSTKLSICTVNIGGGVVDTILTGAPNIVDATYVPVATIGTTLAPDFTIGERKMAGMISRGMICGADEIGLAAESDGGIMILEKNWDTSLLESKVGDSLFDLTFDFPGRSGATEKLPLRDTTFEIDNKFITNRPDLFGVYGNAREWGAVFDATFSPYQSDLSFENTDPFPLKIMTDRCLSYHALKMENISVGKTPFGMGLMMERAGLAPKMDLVDITNCILTEFGQPMHVFDADKVSGAIQVRMAKEGESFMALNGETYTLTDDDMVIADDAGPIALAGVIGGMDSAVSLETKNIIWESATFSAISVRLSAQRHGIRTDASTRYEKSLDPLLAPFSLPRILDYLQFLGKNINITGYGSYLDETQIRHISVSVTYDFINKKSGIIIPPIKVDHILEKLGFEFQEKDDATITVLVPSWRATKDVSLKEDIAEEVIRIFGYDQIPLIPLSSDFTIGGKNTDIALRDMTLAYFARKNWHEVHNYSFSNQILDQALGYENMDDAIGIQNAFNESYTHMRRSLAHRLFENIANNTKHSATLKFFEIGKTYRKFLDTHEHSYSPMASFLSHVEKPPFPEKKMLAGVVIGSTIELLRRDIEGYLHETLGYVPPLHQEENILGFLHPGISADYRIGDESIVKFGQIHPETASFFETPLETLYFEIEYELLLSEIQNREAIFRTPSRYQRIDRELNFVMPERTNTGNISTVINALHPWIHEVLVDSIYRDDEKIGKDQKSVNFSFFLQSDESTISDDEALTIQNSIISRMEQEGIILRSI